MTAEGRGDSPAYRCNCGQEFPSHLARVAHGATCPVMAEGRGLSPAKCANPDHARPVAAVATLTYPDGRFDPVTACKSDLPWLVRQALDYGAPVLVTPVVPDA